jgi:hypothetical protein
MDKRQVEERVEPADFETYDDASILKSWTRVSCSCDKFHQPALSTNDGTDRENCVVTVNLNLTATVWNGNKGVLGEC